jgi:hypothetical protein
VNAAGDIVAGGLLHHAYIGHGAGATPLLGDR